MAGYLERQGYARVEAVAGGGDRGGDLRCRDALGRLVLVHVRRYPPAIKVGLLKIRQLDAMTARHLAVRAVCVTTSEFTTPARAMAASLGVVLADGDALAAHHRSTHPVPRRQPPAEKSRVAVPATPAGPRRARAPSWWVSVWRKARGDDGG